MIVLDTNVISEGLKPQPDQALQTWLDAQPAETLYLTSVTLAELWFGIGVMPAGRRKTALETAVEGLGSLFAGRVLVFDTSAARCYADRAVRARANGLGLPTPDGYIAAIAAAHGYAVATRDTAPFKAAGVEVLNPWEPPLPS